MTLVEFLAPLRKSTHGSRVLAVLYYKERFENVTSLDVASLRLALRAARVAGAATTNFADVLGRLEHLVDSKGGAGSRLSWSLTASGRARVESELADTLKAVDATVPTKSKADGLDAVLGTIGDAEIKRYLSEATTCLRAGALRASVVFVWAAAVRDVHHKLFVLGGTPVLLAIQKHDPNVKKLNRVDDFAYVKDSVALLAARDLGLFDKAEKDTLEEALDLRNRCGHPSKYNPGPQKVASFIEDVVSILFSEPQA